MELQDNTWTIIGLDKTSGKNSTLMISKRRAGNCDYNYAMLVNENIGVDTTCSRMPATTAGLTFSNVSLDHQVSPRHAHRTCPVCTKLCRVDLALAWEGQWTTRADCKGNAACDCGNSATVNGGEVTLGWHT